MELTCKTCDKNFHNQEAYNYHFTNQIHLRNQSYERSIFISNLHATISIDDLIRHISQFGKIKKYDVVNSTFNNVTIEFNDKDPVKAILCRPVFVNNVQLNIYPLKYCNKKGDENKQLSYNTLKQTFNTQTNFDNQLIVLINAISLTDSDIGNRYLPVCKTIDKLFQAIFPKSRSYIFGSIGTGLGLKNSDLDIYLDIGVPVVEKVYINGPHIITMDRLFSIVEKILRNNSKIFTKCFPIRQAKMPIVKFFYLPTMVQCDISFKNSLAMYNSQLVQYILSIDYRFKPLMMIIKYWFYNCELEYVFNITKYALSMLLIFYLQQIKLVPRIIDLQKKCMVPVFVNGWQVNFSRETENFKPQNHYKNMQITELLGEFFKFYANYDFKTQILCPIDGNSYSKQNLEVGKFMSPGMLKYEKYILYNHNAETLSFWKSLCLQDPIELNNNLTKNVHNANLEKFQNYCLVASKIVKNASKNNYQSLLPDLLSNIRNSLTVNPLKQETAYLKIYPPEIREKNWYNLTLYLIKQILENVLRLEIEFIDDHSHGQTTQKDVISNLKNENLMVLQCKGNQRLWFNRKDIKVNGNFKNILEKEILRSKLIAADTNNASNVVINVECHIFKKVEPISHMHIIIYDKGCSAKIFPDFTNYFLAKTPSMLTQFFKTMKNNPRACETTLKDFDKFIFA